MVSGRSRGRGHRRDVVRANLSQQELRNWGCVWFSGFEFYFQCKDNDNSLLLALELIYACGRARLARAKHNEDNEWRRRRRCRR